MKNILIGVPFRHYEGKILINVSGGSAGLDLDGVRIAVFDEGSSIEDLPSGTYEFATVSGSPTINIKAFNDD